MTGDPIQKFVDIIGLERKKGRSDKYFKKVESLFIFYEVNLRLLQWNNRNFDQQRYNIITDQERSY